MAGGGCCWALGASGRGLEPLAPLLATTGGARSACAARPLGRGPAPGPSVRGTCVGR
eukprot:COSAG01_NODE_17918_length_1114_cov_2.246305_2_plen_56_part_01